MAIEDTTTRAAGALTSRFCAECGTELQGGRFCPGCGEQVNAGPFPRHDAAVGRGAGVAEGYARLDQIDETVRMSVPPPAGPPAPPAQRGRRRWPIVLACVVLALAAGAVAVVVLLQDDDARGHGGAGANKVYAGDVGKLFRPVDRANGRLSTALERLDGAKRPSAGTRTAVANARAATNTAQGALGTLDVPKGSSALQTKMRQALDREQTYLRAVNLALARPASPGVSEVQSLAGNLTSSLEAVGAPVTGVAENVTGADALTAWASRVRRAKARAKQTPAATGGSSAAPTTPTPAAPSSAPTKSCGALTVSSSTTCGFANNVYDAWLDAPGTANTVSAFSPTTGVTYTMTCSDSGGSITCTGGNNAVVSWPW